ncbi:MAG: hypothetical protein QOF21_1452 [Actinomycetota bacterium]|jgi:hypothetical protein
MRQMRSLRRGALTALLLLAFVTAACKADGAHTALRVADPTTTSVAPTTTTTTLPPTTTTAAPSRVVAAAVADTRTVLDTGFRPFLAAENVVLNYPTARVERVGFHESKLAAGRLLQPLPDAGETFVMPSRDRQTQANTAADVLSDPDGEVRAPVTGRIKRGGTYTLYCKYTDSFLVIEPDAHPGWEVKLLHITGLLVTTGQRVEAGVTAVAAHPTRLPFASQVEDYSAQPVWPHVHLEVDDPSIKNPPGVGGPGCT